MLLISHFDKTVMNTGYYFHQGSTNRPIDQESKYCENELTTIKCHVTSQRHIFAIYPRLNWTFPILKHFDDVQSLKTNFTKFAHHRLQIRKVIEFFDFQFLMQHPLRQDMP